MIAVAKHKPNIMQPPPSVRTSFWDSLDEPEPDESTQPVRGPAAVQHRDGARGRRSALFPDLNITATAKELGITKSHLAKILSGRNKPSLDLAQKIADALGKDLAFVAALGHNKSRQPVDGKLDGTPKRKRK
jgi:DNA-binding XRE family transcriptional regulator